MKRTEMPGLLIIESDLRTTSPKFEVFVTMGTRKDDLFVTSPVIRRVIKDYNLMENQRVGQLQAKIGHGVLTFSLYYPIGHQHSYQNEMFKGTETARYIESKILKKLQKYHTIKKIKHTDIEVPRKKQVQKIGYTEKQIYEQQLDFKTYLKRLTKKTAELIKRTRRK